MTNHSSNLKITSQTKASSYSVLEVVVLFIFFHFIFVFIKDMKVSFPFLKYSVNIQSETGLIRAQVGLLLAQPIGENLRDLQPLIYVGDPTANKRDHLERRGFDLNLPAEEEGNHISTTMVADFQSVVTKAQAAAQARQRRLGLIRSKKRFSRFLSTYQFK